MDPRRLDVSCQNGAVGCADSNSPIAQGFVSYIFRRKQAMFLYFAFWEGSEMPLQKTSELQISVIQ